MTWTHQTANAGVVTHATSNSGVATHQLASFVTDFLLKEDGGAVLLENGSKIYLESTGVFISWTHAIKS